MWQEEKDVNSEEDWGEIRLSHLVTTFLLLFLDPPLVLSAQGPRVGRPISGNTTSVTFTYF